MKNVLLILVTLLVASVLPAQDGLYAPVLPDDIALVRVINASGDGGAASTPIGIDIGTVRIGPVFSGSGSAYRPVRPGVYVIFAGGFREPLTAATKTFHTILVTANGINILRDTHHEDPLRSQFILYNMTSGPLRLDAVVPSAPLLDEIGPGDANSVVINAIPVTVAAVRPGLAGTDAGPEDQYETTLTLERGDSYALVVTESGPALTGFVVLAKLSTAEESTGAE